MKKTRDLKGMPVLSLQEGEQLGRVRDLIVDPVAAQVVALVLDQRTSARESQVVATANIRNIGEAAITIEDRSGVVPISRIPRFKELARAKKPLYGKLVLSESGTRLGHVADLEVDLTSFRIATIVLRGFMRRGRTISAEQVRTIGSDAVVVRDEPWPEGRVEWPAPAPAPTVSVPPVEAPVEPGPILVETSPAPIHLEPAQEAEPAIPSVSTVSEPPASPPAELLPLAETVAPVTAAEPPPPSDQEATPTEPVEPAAAREEEQPAENAWQRWMRQLRRRDE